MNWNKNIHKCFGSEDNIFAGHPIEIGFARIVLEEALNSGVSSWNEFCEPFKDYLKSKGLSASAIEKQMKRIQDLNRTNTMKLPIFTTVEKKRLAYDYEQVHSLKDAVKILKNWKSLDLCNTYFRGQAEGSWKIFSSSQREWMMKELDKAYGCYGFFLKKLLEFFKENGNLFLERHCKVVTDISIFSTIQHYGAPTPFVDWTSNFDVALYFASLGNENCVGFETDSYFSVYCLTVGKGAETPDNDLCRFSTLLENHKAQMKDVQREWGKIPGSDYREALKFDVWKEFPIIWMEESDDEWMQIANPRSDLQGGAFVNNNSPEKSLDQIFTGRKMSDMENTDELLLPKIRCLDIHKSVLPQLQDYLKAVSSRKRNTRNLKRKKKPPCGGRHGRF